MNTIAATKTVRVILLVMSGVMRQRNGMKNRVVSRP